MWFRNLQIYLLSDPFEFSAEELHDRLRNNASRKCGSLEMSTLGWERPLGRNGTQLTHAVTGCTMICARREQKVLPPAVIRERLTEKVGQLEETEHRRVGRREQKEIRDVQSTGSNGFGPNSGLRIHPARLSLVSRQDGR